MIENPSCLVVVYVIEGEGKHNLGGLDVTVKPGEMYMIPSAEADAVREVDVEKSLQWIRLVFRAESLGMAAPILPMRWKVLGEHRDELIRVLEEMSPYLRETANVPEVDPTSVWTQFMAFFLSPSKANLQTFEENEVTIRRAIHEMGHRFMTRFSVSEISRKAAMSTRQFQRKFKSLTGITYMKLLQEVRIRHSCGLLRFTRLSVQKIAESVGIYDMHHFYRLFREYCGTTPSEFRHYNSLSGSEWFRY
ncbi:helix-turn-helix domain-containing protein [Cohnella sp.]|uniref:helix-turn-helix domain-containing protein n=1 Tax=Cohnella sp. TaxID=1883426 RepID=UPI00356872C6